MFQASQVLVPSSKGNSLTGLGFHARHPKTSAYKELFPVVLAAPIWAPQWSRNHVMFRCDNKVVHILNS